MTTPVSYRAGTDVSHAHSFLHFLSDAASGSMDHHRRFNANHAAGVGQIHAETPHRIAAAPLGTPVFEPFRGALERATAMSLVLLTTLFFFGGGTSLATAPARALVGIDARPPVPPPRPALLGAF